MNPASMLGTFLHRQLTVEQVNAEMDLDLSGSMDVAERSLF